MLNFKDFVSSQVGKIFVFGLLLLIGYFSGIAFLYLFSPKEAYSMLVMTVTNFFFGRAAGISYGFTAEFSDTLIIIANMLIEFITVMLIYPIFVLSWEKSMDIKMFRTFFAKVKEQRVKYNDLFNKYGVYGLFLFVWFPFWMTGPVVGSLIGFLIGVRHYITMFIVLTGTSLAIVIWTYFLKELMLVLNYLSSSAGYILLGAFVVIAIVLKLKKSKNK